MKAQKSRPKIRASKSESVTSRQDEMVRRDHTGGQLPQSEPLPDVRTPFLFPAWALCVLFVVFFGIGWALQSPGFHEPMVYDSREWIANKAQVFATRDLGNVMAIVPVRPLFMLSLYANYLWAGMDTSYFRAVNVAILALAAGILVLLTSLVFEIHGLQNKASRREKQVVAVFLGLWFVVHPLQSFVVLYDWQREAIMGCFFYFAALAAYIAGRSACLGRPFRAYGLTAVLFLAGMMSKENVATLPLVLILTELTLFRQGFRQVVRRAAVIAMITLSVLVVYFVVTNGLHGKESVHPQSVLARLHEYYTGSGLTLVQVILTESRVWFSYLSMILAPFMQGIQFLKAETVSVSLWEPPVTFAALAGVVALVAAGLGLARRKPVAAFGILFFVVTLLPESLLIPTYLFFGYRAILPMAGILLVLGEVLFAAAAWGRSRVPTAAFRAISLAVLAIPLVGMGTMTFEQAHRWSPLSFWAAAFSGMPLPPKNLEVIPYFDIITGLGGELVAVGRYEQAIQLLKLADEPGQPGLSAMQHEIVPKRASALINLGLAHKKSGQLAEAVNYYRKALEIDPRSAIAWTNLGLALEAMGDVPQAMQDHRKALELAPDLPEPHFNLGCLLLGQGKWDEALPYFERAVQLRPDYAEALANLGVTLLHVGRVEEAIPNLQKAAGKLTENVELHNTLGAALAETGRTGEAIRSFQKALALRPDHKGAKQNLEFLLRETGGQ